MIFNIVNFFSLWNNSFILIMVGGIGNGGNINLLIEFFFVRDDSDIIVNVFEGNGGNISIVI